MLERADARPRDKYAKHSLTFFTIHQIRVYLLGFRCTPGRSDRSPPTRRRDRDRRRRRRRVTPSPALRHGDDDDDGGDVRDVARVFSRATPRDDRDDDDDDADPPRAGGARCRRETTRRRARGERRRVRVARTSVHWCVNAFVDSTRRATVDSDARGTESNRGWRGRVKVDDDANAETDAGTGFVTA